MKWKEVVSQVISEVQWNNIMVRSLNFLFWQKFSLSKVANPSLQYVGAALIMLYFFNLWMCWIHNEYCSDRVCGFVKGKANIKILFV